MRWLDSINSMDMNLSKLRDIVEDRGDWHVAVHGVAKGRYNLAAEQKQQKLLEQEGSKIELIISKLDILGRS